MIEGYTYLPRKTEPSVRETTFEGRRVILEFNPDPVAQLEGLKVLIEASLAAKARRGNLN